VNCGNASLGNLFAIPLETLYKLKETTSAKSNKENLLDHFVNLILNSYPQLEKWDLEIRHLKEASECKWEATEMQINDILAEVNIAISETQNLQLMGPQDNFIKVKEHLTQHKKDIDAIVAQKEKVYNLWKDVAISFGSEPSKIAPEKFFEIINSFANDFKAVLKKIQDENAKQLAKAKKAAIEEKLAQIEARKKAVEERKKNLAKQSPEAAQLLARREREREKAKEAESKADADAMAGVVATLASVGPRKAGRPLRKGQRTPPKSATDQT